MFYLLFHILANMLALNGRGKGMCVTIKESVREKREAIAEAGKK